MGQTKPANTGAPAAMPTERVLSVDALRGFDMFWIAGGQAFVMSSASCSQTRCRHGWIGNSITFRG